MRQVLLVGDTGSGKTSLWRSLMQQRPCAQLVLQSTDGVEVYRLDKEPSSPAWSVDAPNGTARMPVDVATEGWLNI